MLIWAYHTTCKVLMTHTPFNLFYQKEMVTPLEYLTLGLHISIDSQMLDAQKLQEHLDMFIYLEDHHYLVVYH